MPQILQDILFVFLVAAAFVALFRVLEGAIQWGESRRGAKKSGVADGE